MPDHTSARTGPDLCFESFGVRIRIVVGDPQDLEDVRPLSPPGSTPAVAEDLDATFTLLRDSASEYELRRDSESQVAGLAREDALATLERELHALVALEAPDHIFVHAGVVGHRGAAILLPGSSHAGKTNLVAALVRAGAEYYSDEFGPLDSSGLVHPFAKPLSIRDERFRQVDHHVDALGGTAGEEPLPVTAVVVTTYESGAGWSPRRLSSGEAVLAVLAHTVPAQSRPTEALRAISRSVEGAAVLEGPRGEAEALAPVLLAELERSR